MTVKCPRHVLRAPHPKTTRQRVVCQPSHSCILTQIEEVTGTARSDVKTRSRNGPSVAFFCYPKARKACKGALQSAEPDIVLPGVACDITLPFIPQLLVIITLASGPPPTRSKMSFESTQLEYRFIRAASGTSTLDTGGRQVCILPSHTSHLIRAFAAATRRRYQNPIYAWTSIGWFGDADRLYSRWSRRSVAEVAAPRGRWQCLSFAPAGFMDILASQPWAHACTRDVP
ncbi:hypothetical protein L209DRAFT_330331 [Thermothelomyces heterothallicus CBS 203.75]